MLFKNPFAEDFSISEGNDNGPFVNITVRCTNPAALWGVVSNFLNGDTELSEQIRSCSIVICQGDQEWDDYFLLHHFNTSLPLDEFSEPA